MSSCSDCNVLVLGTRSVRPLGIEVNGGVRLDDPRISGVSLDRVLELTPSWLSL